MNCLIFFIVGFVGLVLEIAERDGKERKFALIYGFWRKRIYIGN